jgi:hypothetical protein
MASNGARHPKFDICYTDAKLLTVATVNTDTFDVAFMYYCTNGMTSRKLTKKRVIFYDDFDDSRKCLTMTSRKTGPKSGLQSKLLVNPIIRAI